MELHFKKNRLTLCFVAFTLIVAETSTAAGATLTFPSASCNTSLQACVNFAAPDDTVQVATNVPIGADLTIDKSLTLRPAAGFSPVLNNSARVILLNAEPKSNNIVFEGFTLDPADVRAIQSSSKAFDVRIRDLTVTHTSGDRPPIDIGTSILSTYGPVTFEISGNNISIPNSINTVHAILANGGHASTFQGTIHDNTILDMAGVEGAGILVANNTSQLAVDVIGNKITGTNFNNGISLFQFGEGSAQVRFINNLVEGQVTESGQPGAMTIGVSGGHASFLVANNTLVNSNTGISIGGREDLGATWNGVVANNIVADASNWGIIIDDPFSSVINENNLVFGTGNNFFTSGSGTLFVDPQFIGGGDYRLNFASPAKDAGNSARVPTDITLDLGGLPRIQGMAVDMGAYETVPEPPALMILLPVVVVIVVARRTTRPALRWSLFDRHGT